MVGKYDIEIYNNRVHYFLTVRRNITILQGNSATGKSELVRLIREHAERGASSGITLKCDARCSVLTSEDWEMRLDAFQGRIVFIDEAENFLKSKRFAEKVRGSDNYFVLITRDDLEELPYSVEEIYGLRNVSGSGKYKTFRKVYNETYRIYHLSVNEKIAPEKVITEDSGSGFECFQLIYPERCEPAGGRSRIYEAIRKTEGKTVLAIVDGAAFGCEIGKVMGYLRTHEKEKNYVLYAPESFEYLILSSGIVDVPDAILTNTYSYADSKEYISWEEFFTAYLSSITRNTVYQYSKSFLGQAYKTKGSLQKLTNILPEAIQPEKS